MNALPTTCGLAHPPAQSRWYFFSTPLPQFLVVMGPLTLMMLVLAFLRAVPVGIRISSAAVACISLYAFWRGYLGRVEATPRHVRYHRWRKDIVIPWQEVRLMDRYIPLDRNRHCRYVFITRLDTPPVDHREVDENTIQLQDRPGLLETLMAYRQRGRHGDSPSLPAVATCHTVSRYVDS